MHRIDKKLAGIEQALVMIGSDPRLPVEGRETLPRVLESVIAARRELKALMPQGLR